jgi:hypothetical protein
LDNSNVLIAVEFVVVAPVVVFSLDDEVLEVLNLVIPIRFVSNQVHC